MTVDLVCGSLFPPLSPPKRKINACRGETKLLQKGYISLVSTSTCTGRLSALTHYIFQNGSHTTPAGILLISTSGKCVCVCGVIKGSGEKVRPERERERVHQHNTADTGLRLLFCVKLVLLNPKVFANPLSSRSFHSSHSFSPLI